MRSTLLLFFTGLVSATLGGYFLSQTTKWSYASQARLYPPKDLKHFTLGFGEVVADSLWIRFLQDVDVCQDGLSQTERAQEHADSVVPLGSTSEEDGDFLQSALGESRSAPKCRMGWAYAMLDAISELAPRFQLPYSFGGSILSILVQDKEGAALIMSRGLEIFPEDWRLHYQLAYHYLYELGQADRAAEHMRRAALYGAPGWVYALSARLYSEAGQLEFGIKVLEDAMKLDVLTWGGKERVEKRLIQLREERDRAAQ